MSTLADFQDQKASKKQRNLVARGRRLTAAPGRAAGTQRRQGLRQTSGLCYIKALCSPSSESAPVLEVYRSGHPAVLIAVGNACDRLQAWGAARCRRCLRRLSGTAARQCARLHLLAQQPAAETEQFVATGKTGGSRLILPKPLPRPALSTCSSAPRCRRGAPRQLTLLLACSSSSAAAAAAASAACRSPPPKQLPCNHPRAGRRDVRCCRPCAAPAQPAAH